MIFIRPAASQACGQQCEPTAPDPFTALRPAIAMALLLASASSHLACTTLGSVARRNLKFNESALASTSGRAACLASSASCQVYGGSELASWKTYPLASRKQARRMHTVRIRSQRTTEGGNRRSLDTWIGRLAMLGFAAAIGVEVSTGKGLLASAELPLPIPTPVLGLIALAGAVTAFGVFRSSDRD